MSKRKGLSDEAIAGLVILLVCVPYIYVAIQGTRVVYSKLGWVVIPAYLGGAVFGLLSLVFGLTGLVLLARRDS